MGPGGTDDAITDTKNPYRSLVQQLQQELQERRPPEQIERPFNALFGNLANYPGGGATSRWNVEAFHQPNYSINGGPKVNHVSSTMQRQPTTGMHVGRPICQTPEHIQRVLGNVTSRADPTQIRIVWNGGVEWTEKIKGKTPNDPTSEIKHGYLCRVLSSVTATGEIEVSTVGWPQKLILAPIPNRSITSSTGYFKTARKLLFNFDSNNYELERLKTFMTSGYAFGIFIMSPHKQKTFILLFYYGKQNIYVGYIPNDVENCINSIYRKPASTTGTGVSAVPAKLPAQDGLLPAADPSGGPSTSTGGETIPNSTKARYLPSSLTATGSSPTKRKSTDAELPSSSTPEKLKKDAANTIIDRTFSCMVCLGPMRCPVITSCCRCLVACKQCSTDWSTKDKSCIKCRAPNAEYTAVLGLDEGINALKDKGLLLD